MEYYAVIINARDRYQAVSMRGALYAHAFDNKLSITHTRSTKAAAQAAARQANRDLALARRCR